MTSFINELSATQAERLLVRDSGISYGIETMTLTTGNISPAWPKSFAAAIASANAMILKSW